MEIRIDLRDLFSGDGTEQYLTMEEAVQAEIIRVITRGLQERTTKIIDEKVNAIISTTLSENITTRMPALIDEVMDAEFTPIDRYGVKGKPTTFRGQIVETIANQMKYERKQSQYERNAFTKAVDDTVERLCGEFKSQYTKLVDEQFAASVLSQATENLRKKLGLQK